MAAIPTGAPSGELERRAIISSRNQRCARQGEVCKMNTPAGRVLISRSHILLGSTGCLAIYCCDKLLTGYRGGGMPIGIFGERSKNAN